MPLSKRGKLLETRSQGFILKRVFLCVGFDEWQTKRKLIYDEVQVQAHNWWITRFKHKTKFYSLNESFLIVILIRQLDSWHGFSRKIIFIKSCIFNLKQNDFKSCIFTLVKMIFKHASKIWTKIIDYVLMIIDYVKPRLHDNRLWTYDNRLC